MTVYWITETPYPTSEQVAAEADAAGADAVLHGIPPALAAVIPSGTVGLVTVPDEPVEVPDDPVVTLARLLLDATSLDEVRAAAHAALVSLGEG